MSTEFDPQPNRVALIDIDGTLAEGPVQLDFIKAQIEDKIIVATTSLERALENLRESFGNGDYSTPVGASSKNPAEELFAAHALSLKGVSENKAKDHAKEFYNQDGLWLPYAGPSFQVLKNYRYARCLLSAGFDLSVNAIADVFGATESFCTTYEVTQQSNNSSVYTGKILVDLSTSGMKAKAALKALGKFSKKDSIMLADNEADIGALSEVDGPFCMNASEGLINAAKEFGGQIIAKPELYNKQIPAQILAWLMGRTIHYVPGGMPAAALSRQPAGSTLKCPG